jgi:hypothetical protein
VSCPSTPARSLILVTDLYKNTVVLLFLVHYLRLGTRLVNRSNIASHCSLVLCLLSGSIIIQCLHVESPLQIKSTYQVHFRKRYIESIHIAAVERRAQPGAQHMAKNTVSCFSGSNFFRMYFETKDKRRHVGWSDVDEQQILVHFELK